jgi:serine protease Do
MRKVLFFMFFLLNFSFYAQAKELPDFTELVKDHGASVVNITTTQLVKTRNGFEAMPGMPNTEMYDFFRRFMPPPGAQGKSREVPIKSSGSGFIISSDGYILTNAHVVDGADEVIVKLTDKRELKAKVIGTDARSDIALIKIAANNLPKVPIGNPQQLQVGEWVLAIGSPFGFENSVTAGIVSAKGRSLPSENFVPFIQTDVAINPGNSGGPLFNMKGEVVGINSQILSRSGGYMGLSFAIPIDVAMQVADQIKAHGKVQRSKLGVVIQELNAGNASAFGLSTAEGALVSEVEKDSPAAKAGIKSGDIILKLNDQAIKTSLDLPNLVSMTKPGTTVKLQIWRNHDLITVLVTVVEMKSDAIAKNGDAQTDRTANKIGLIVSNITPAERDQIGITHGIVVQNSDGLAARAGIQTGDIILAVGNTSIDNTAQFNKIIEKTSKGNSIALLIKRDESRLYLPVHIE